ncbi:MAG: formylglycine-generating enzyme family protein [Patescibacteria group bacterium]
MAKWINRTAVILGVTILILSSGCGKSSGEATSKATGIEMVLIPAGEFTMGSTKYGDERPVQKVYVDAFYIDKYEITNAEYEKFDSVHKSEKDKYSNGDDNPVVYVSWWDAIKYCNWRSGKEGLEPCYNENTGECDFTKSGYRLPTETEWEKAARGTDGRKYPWGNEEPDAGGRHRANYSASGDGYQYLSPVGSYESGKSPYGVYNMAGNVWEWCNDWYGKDYYKNSPYKNPKGPGSGEFRVLRGGSWFHHADDLRTAYRYKNYLNVMGSFYGFRCVRTP